MTPLMRAVGSNAWRMKAEGHLISTRNLTKVPNFPPVLHVIIKGIILQSSVRLSRTLLAIYGSYARHRCCGQHLPGMLQASQLVLIVTADICSDLAIILD